MKLETGWWGIVLRPDDKKDNEILLYLADNIHSAGRGDLDIYEEGEVTLTMVEPPTDNWVYSLAIRR